MALIHEWKLDETTGTTAVDSVGSLNGTISGGVTLNQPSNTAVVNPPLSTSFSFNGSTGGVDLGDNLNFTQTDTFTISAWVKVSTASSGPILSSLSSAAGFDLALSSSGRANLLMKANSGSGYVHKPTATNYPVGSWFLLTCTHDGNGNIPGIGIYFNGVDAGVGSVHSSLPSTGNMFDSTHARIGERGDQSASLNGSIDNVRVYNTRLLPAEVLAEYNAYFQVPSAAPVDDTATTPANTLINIAVLTNDTGITGGETITITTHPTNGTASVNTDGVTIDYTPSLDYAGSDSFAYDIDASGSPATVTLNVQQLLVDDSATIDSGQFTTFDVLLNDILSSPTVLTIQSQGTLGNATVNGLNGIDYQAGSVEGTDTVIYNANGDLATITIEVTGSLQADSFTVTANQTKNLDVRANDTAAGATTVPIQPTNGAVTVLPDDSINYTPAQNFIGADSFTYNVGTHSAIVSIVVQAPEGFLVDDHVLTPMNTAILIDVLANDTITS